jgi:hypothetical protein
MEKDCLTLDTFVSNSNEDSEQRQTKVHREEIKNASGDWEIAGSPQFRAFSGLLRPLVKKESLGRIGK